uniref:Uncharacterized protein n=1 Tax=Rhizophora mucronata TaxID=61149 RepID=A0A2P2QIF0_RHIMU
MEQKLPFYVLRVNFDGPLLGRTRLINAFLGFEWIGQSSLSLCFYLDDETFLWWLHK